jgi:Rad3-related DNA helicase
MLIHIHSPVVSVLGSRAQLCIHPEISSLHGTKQNAACRALVSRRGCRFHRQAKDHAKELSTHSSDQVLDIEELVRVGRERESCPYYLARELQASGEILFLPYNYLIDPSIRSTLSISLEDAVIILDEAHNVVGCEG